MPIEFGLGMRSRPTTEQLKTWMEVLDESLPLLEKDYESLWISDHFFWNDIPTMEAWTTLTYMAARWPQFKIGPIVLGQSYRNPALLAKMASTLQFLTNGRFMMGIGAGWKEDEYHAYNYPFPSPGVRIEQLIDTLEIMKRLWTEPGKVSYEGKQYSIKDAYLEPKPNPVPLIVLGGSGDRMLNVVAKYADWWNMTEMTFERYANRAAALRVACEKIGRDPESMRYTWWGRLIVGKTEAEAIERGEGVWTRDNCIIGTPEQCVEQMQAYVDIGVSYFMTMLPNLPDREVIAQVTEEILPKVRAAGE